ncbi:YeiH family protein [Sanguibacter suarezii]|uniref:YeiH family protein n=1 Tax=Sanguibacter suarezii TaxID=60921 RepID=UPI0008326D53|nr:putative sulfate exporter family transporter [Sanguibacter suarezii]
MNVAPRINALTPGLTPALGPGLALALVATAVSSVTSWALGEVSGAVISPLVVALVLGAVLGSLRRTPATASDGLAWTTKHVLRAGVVLLGLKLSLGQVAELGWRGVAVIAATVACTFLGTLVVGKIMGVARLTRLYVATGFSICGAVAIAAMAGTVQPRQRVSAAPSDAGGALGSGAAGADGAGVALVDEHESADALGTSLALVTIYGSLAIFVLPWLVSLLGLDDAQAGLWIGASVQEVGQVVAAAGVVSTTALAAATVAKLARVVLLAPLTAGVALGRQAGDGAQPGDRAKVAPIPLFVVGFLAAVLVRSTGVLPTGLLTVAETASNLMLTAAMFALGTGVDLRRLVTTGGRPLALGAIATMIAVGVSLAGVLLLG